MSIILTMHPEVLDQKNKEFFAKLANFLEFYLAGGTALALQVGHRVSVDFDLFSEKEIPKGLVVKVKQVFSGEPVAVSVNNPDELTVFVSDTKVSFIHYPFPRILDLVHYEGVSLLHANEIAASKAYTIGRRGSYKDYIDLYFTIFENYASLQEIMKLAERKYQIEFNARLFLEQLIYLEDIGDTSIIFTKNEISKEDVKRFFEGEIQKMEL